MERVTTLYREGLPRGASTGWSNVDDIFTLNPGSLVIVTGTPGSGKSQMIDNMLVNAMKQHNWRVAYASFENPPELHLAKLISLKAGKPFGDGPTPRMSEQDMLETLGWVNERLTFLTNDGVMPTVESLIERFEAAVRRSGVKACVVDPFNFIKLSQKKDGGVDTESINEMLAQFKTFALRAEVTFFLIAHPAKPMNAGQDWVPTGYSISGSAHFYNRADFGLTIQRKMDQTVFHVWKCRFPWQGQIGDATLFYDKATGLFTENQGETQDDKLWLKGFDEVYNF
jgi:twinkle protein